MIESGLEFIITHIDVEGERTIELIDGHLFRPATDGEVILIQDKLKATTMSGYTHEGIPYDMLVKIEEQGTSKRFHKEPLPREQWKYWVIAYNGYNAKIRDLQHAALLLPVDLDFGFTLMFAEKDQGGDLMGWSYMRTHLMEKYLDHTEVNKNAEKVNSNDLKKIGEYYDSLTNLPDNAQFIQHAVKNYLSMRTIPRMSELKVVGYFSIIESLITHAPRLNESLDSISHQIANKMILLQKQFGRKISPNDYFLKASEEKIWKKLYSYRSCIAHGSVPDFDNSFQILKGKDDIVNFLHEIIKELVIIGLKDHEFLADLKKC